MSIKTKLNRKAKIVFPNEPDYFPAEMMLKNMGYGYCLEWGYLKWVNV